MLTAVFRLFIFHTFHACSSFPLVYIPQLFRLNQAVFRFFEHFMQKAVVRFFCHAMHLVCSCIIWPSSRTRISPSFLDEMAREIRARIGSARLLLDVVAGQPSHLAASRTQCVALVETVKRSSVSVDERATLSELALGVQWAGVDGKIVAEAFVPALKGQRHKMQDWQCIHEYFLESEWDHMLGVHATLSSRIEVLLNRAIKLGCRCPSEHTLKHMTSFLLVLSEPADRLGLVNASQKSDLMQHIKGEFKKWARRADEPVEYMLQLPACVNTLRQLHPMVINIAYSSGQSPIPCRIDIKLVHSVNFSFKCRGGNAASSQGVPVLQLGGQLGGQGLGQLERFASCMMEGMSRMQATQTRLMDCFLGQGSASHAQLPTLANMVDRRPLAAALGDRPALAATLLDRPAIAAASVDPPSEFSSPRTPMRKVLELKSDEPCSDDMASTSASCTGSASEGALRLLSMIDERDAEKKALAKPKAKAGAEQPTAAKPKVAAKPKASAKQMTPPKPKAAAMNKRKALQLELGEGDDKDDEQPNPNIVAKPPYFTIERTRGQAMCRTGLGGPGSSHKISFGKGKSVPNEAAAKAAARKWVQAELKRQGRE
jgi:hypothetical protein